MEQQCCRYPDACPPDDYQPEQLPPFEPRTRKGARPEELGGYRLEAFGNSRYWQVIDPAGELVCVAVYKRGGREVMRRLATETKTHPQPSGNLRLRGTMRQEPDIPKLARIPESA
jgi:hypothetical protein